MHELVLPRAIADLARVPVTSRAVPPVRETVLLGMPQLSGLGLSETWLLKELGHRHWMMLAGAAGMPVPDLRDEAGRPVYAAFCAVRIEGARFERARENGVLDIASSIARVSRTQVLGRHDLALDGRPAGTVEMVSTFVKRNGGSNHSIARVALDFPVPVDPRVAPLVAVAADFRAGRISRHFDFDLAEPREIASFTFDPCPAQDFNGAGFLYFTSFLGFVDRAEWQLDRASPPPLSRREVFYYGNVDPGEMLQVALVADRRTGHVQARWWRIRRNETDTVLADVFTRRDAEAPSFASFQ